jgi:WD repeat-containing protein 90
MRCHWYSMDTSSLLFGRVKAQPGLSFPMIHRRRAEPLLSVTTAEAIESGAMHRCEFSLYLRACAAAVCCQQRRRLNITQATAPNRSLSCRDAGMTSPSPAEPTALASVLDGGPCAELVRLNGFTGEYSHAMARHPATSEIVFIAAHNLVAMDVSTQKQRFFHGHTESITAFAFDGAHAHLSAHLCQAAFECSSAQGLQTCRNAAAQALTRKFAAGEGKLIASAQEGKSALVRLWDAETAQCLAILCGHASGMSCVDVSGDGRALLAVGLDSHSKQQITLWDISDVGATRRASVLLKSTTEYNIKRAKFSPYEPDKFMTVGRDSIRLYRVKNGGLRGLSIQVQLLAS